MITITIIFFIISGVTIVNAFFEDSVSVTNHIAMGDVNIGIIEYELKNGREVLYENSKKVFPGDLISKIPRIMNYGKECWVRVNISYENDQEEIEGFEHDNLIGMSEDWVLCGDHFYYKKILGLNEAADVFKYVRIPGEWNEEHSSQKLSIIIQAEAIQAANFQPDFSAMSPWGNQEIELCIHEENGASTCVKKEMQLSVEFNGTAHKLLAVPDNFFHNIKRAMPGDYFRDEILLYNTTKKEAELFFRTSLTEMTDLQRDLLEKIHLGIEMNGEKLYDGNLLSKELETEISMGNYAPGEKGTLQFEIEVPKELNNAYALREADVNWIFTVREDEAEALAGNRDNDGGLSKDAVKTGDTTPVLLWGFLILMSGIMIFGGTMIKKKGASKYEK